MPDEVKSPQIQDEPRDVTSTEDHPGAASLDYAGQAGESIAETGRQMAGFVGHFTEMAKAEAAVGPAQSAGGHTLVPLASVSVQAGFGLGFGGGGGGEAKYGGGGGSAGGSGGGGRTSTRVIAVADISEDGVRVQPVPDVTALALGVMALIGLRMLRRGRGGGSGRRFMGWLRRP
jgi:uncharacterized spore protein YtfJ